MYQEFFQALERKPDGELVSLETVIDNLSFNQDGLIPVVTQDAKSKTVLMMAWMNKSSIEKTLQSGRMTYWSRSRQAFWVKGESSGNTQELVSMHFDCDGDCILCFVNQVGPACHTYRPNCFYLEVCQEQGKVKVIGEGYPNEEGS